MRIFGSLRSGQIVRLRSAKCTIGSSPHCTLRLRAHGVAPVHCLLLRGSAATVVRCWSADTRLNGKSFTDAPLSCGDRLSIGPIELEVLDVGATSPARAAEIEYDGTQNAASQRSEQLAACLAELEAERSALATERDDLETQRNALAEDRRQRQAEQEQAQREIGEQREQIAARSAELESQGNVLAERWGELESHRMHWTRIAGSGRPGRKKLSAASTNNANTSRLNWPNSNCSAGRSWKSGGNGRLNGKLIAARASNATRSTLNWPSFSRNGTTWQPSEMLWRPSKTR